MVHPYLRRREGKEKPEYPKPELRAVLEKTLGVPLFQEQAMKVAIVGAGFTPVEADQLRRAMATFKLTGGVSHFYDKLVGGMVERGYPKDFAERTFKQIEGFGSYGFPESHAASFAKIAYASCWMKPNHPRSEEHTSELQSLMRISYAVFCLKKKTNTTHYNSTQH